VIYLDSSALVKLIISEQETVALHMYLSEHRGTLLTCELALTEVLRVVRRSCYNPQRQLQVSAEDVLDQRMNATGELLDSIDRIVVAPTHFCAPAWQPTIPISARSTPSIWSAPSRSDPN